MAAEKRFIFLRSGLNAYLTLLFDLASCDSISGSQSHTKPSSTAHPSSQHVLLAGLAAAGHKALQIGFESMPPRDTSAARGMNFELLWSYTVGNA